MNKSVIVDIDKFKRDLHQSRIFQPWQIDVIINFLKDNNSCYVSNIDLIPLRVRRVFSDPEEIKVYEKNIFEEYVTEIICKELMKEVKNYVTISNMFNPAFDQIEYTGDLIVGSKRNNDFESSCERKEEYN